jgi:cytochrome c-type biogenesis protein CcmF
MMLLGILISSSKKEILSYNTSGIFVPLGENSKELPGENMTLLKGQKMDMGKYWVTYASDSMHPKKSQWYFKINFEDKKSNETFTITPNAFVNYKGNEGLMANPGSKHYWDHDVFGYITSMTDQSKNQDTSSFIPKSMKVGDTVSYSKNGLIILEAIKSFDSLPVDIFGENGNFMKQDLKYILMAPSPGKFIFQDPRLAIAKGNSLSVPDTLGSGTMIQLDKSDGKQVEIGVKAPSTVTQYLTLKTLKFPFINLLWLGHYNYGSRFCHKHGSKDTVKPGSSLNNLLTFIQRLS